MIPLELHARHFPARARVGAPPLVIAHGLFGSSRNWQGLGKAFAAERDVYVLDLRNHGDSAWSADVSYGAQAADLAAFIAGLGQAADVIGHSMGGKVAMALTLHYPDAVHKLIVADMAPVAYAHNYTDYFTAMRAVDPAHVRSRADADALMQPLVPENSIRAFLLHNLDVSSEGVRWRPNLAGLEAGMPSILGWDMEGVATHETLFLAGGASDYVLPAYEPRIVQQFPEAEIIRLEGAGHWVHAEQPHAFRDVVEVFLDG